MKKIRDNKNYSVIVLLMLFIVLAISGCQKDNKTETIKIDNDLASSSNETKTIINEPVSSTRNVGISSTPVVPSTKSVVEVTSTNFVKKDPEKKIVEVPRELILDVAFAQQAPFANWDSLHEEACEEASMIMVYKYFVHEPLSEIIMEQEIQNLIKWEGDNGYQIDLTAQEAVDVLNSHFGLKARLSTEVTVERIKYELSQGNLIIVPAAGRELGNPNFKQPGPIYHMLVIKGYDGSEFVTNDPGTRKGNGFRYKYDKLIGAVHDWNHQLAEGGMTDAEMATGRKAMIVVSK